MSWIDNVWDGLADVFNDKIGKYQRQQRDLWKDKAYSIRQKYGLSLTDKQIDDAGNNFGTKRAYDKYGDFNIEVNLSSGEKGIGFDSFSISVSNSELETPKDIFKREMKNEALTQILMKNPFAIFANGALYKKGRPGSKTYDPLTVWEPYKYIMGDIKEDEYNDILQNRSHYKLAGNKDYFAHIWDEPNWQMPDRSKTIRYRYDAYNHKIRMLNEGYKELQFLGWYAYYDINNKKPVLNYVQKLNDLYEKEIKAVPKPIYKKNTNQLAYSEGIFKKRKSALF